MSRNGFTHKKEALESARRLKAELDRQRIKSEKRAKEATEKK
jgi:hypothetical protein